MEELVEPHSIYYERYLHYPPPDFLPGLECDVIQDVSLHYLPARDLSSVKHRNYQVVCDTRFLLLH